MKQSSQRENQNIEVAIGGDWADQVHVFHLVAGNGIEFSGEFHQTPESIEAWVKMVRQKFPTATIEICIEQSRGPLISGLLKFDSLKIYPVNPMQLANYRKAMKHGGTKNDPTDAKLLASFLMHYREKLRPLTQEEPATRKLSVLVRDRRQAVDHRTALVLQLKSALKCYFPLVLQLASKRLHANYICQLLIKWPTLKKLQAAKKKTLRNFFYAQNVRGNRVEQKLELILQAEPLVEDAVMLETSSRRVVRLAKLLLVENKAIDDYDREIDQVLQSHADYPIIASLPGAALQMQSRMIAALGTDRERFESAAALQSFSGIAPVTSQSGKTKRVSHRWACPKFTKQTFHEYAGLSIKKSRWAKAYYRLMLSRGKKPQAAKRALAYKWQRIIFRCWQERKPYNEDRYLQRLQTTDSPLLAFLEAI